MANPVVPVYSNYESKEASKPPEYYSMREDIGMTNTQFALMSGTTFNLISAGSILVTVRSYDVRDILLTRYTENFSCSYLQWCGA